MLVAKICVYGGNLVNGPKNRNVILEKIDMQERFEKWLSQTLEHPATGVMCQCNQSRVLGD
jgi:hypothetical protein